MKKVVIGIIILVVFICLIPIDCSSEEKSYSVESAVFDIVLNKDGSAFVVENWEIDYGDGGYSRFYKNILIDLPKDEAFTSIENLKGKINGVECELIPEDNENRPENKLYLTYGKNGDKNIATYGFYFSKELKKADFEISYILNNVVKYVKDEDYYMFTYRALPKGYKDTIKNVIINISSYDGNGNFELLYSTTEDNKNVGNRITVSGNKVSDIYKIRSRIDNVEFELKDSSNINSEDINKDVEQSYFLTVFMWLFWFIVGYNCIMIPINIYRRRNNEKPIHLFGDFIEALGDAIDSDSSSGGSSCSSCSSCGGCGGSD